MIQRLKTWLKTRQMLNVQEFAHAHRRLLVIVCDPSDDTMFVAYHDKIVSGKIRSADGLDYHVVKNVLQHSKFESTIDRFLGMLLDALQAPLKENSNFYGFISGALFKITKSLRFTKENQSL